jgi:hypothetical protein
MIPLPESVTLKGTGISSVFAELIKREGNRAIYLRSDGVYEVIRILTRPQETINGRNYPEREVYPGNEDWGRSGWTATTREHAERLYARILAEDRMRSSQKQTILMEANQCITQAKK